MIYALDLDPILDEAIWQFGVRGSWRRACTFRRRRQIHAKMERYHLIDTNRILVESFRGGRRRTLWEGRVTDHALATFKLPGLAIRHTLLQAMPKISARWKP